MPSVATIKNKVFQGRRALNTRLAALDGLRLVAALMVVAYHYSYRAQGVWGERTSDAFPETAPVAAYGWLGVELFFVISGFVICMSAWGRGLRLFLLSRITRLFPAYWFAIFATVLCVALLDSQRPLPSAGQVLGNVTMLQTPLGIANIDGVYWTLWAELHFYLLFAIVAWRGLTYRRVVAFCLAWTTAATAAAFSEHWRLIFYTDADYSPFFVAGVAMYLIYRFGPDPLTLSIVGVSWALGLWRISPIADFVGTLGPRELWWPGVVMTVTAIFAVMSAVAMRWLLWVQGAWFTAAGTLTYPLYLIHQEIGYALITRLHNAVPRWPLMASVVLMMLISAWLMHRFVERPFASLLKRLLESLFARIGVRISALRQR